LQQPNSIVSTAQKKALVASSKCVRKACASPLLLPCIKLNSPWWASILGGTEGGVVVMHPGEAIKEGPLSLALVSDVLKSLKAIHEAGVLHADIRMPNILNICGSHQLIDFDLSATLEHPEITIQKGGGQADCVGPRVARILGESPEDSVKVSWTKDDDYEMVALLGR
jgi:hypothetical protein